MALADDGVAVRRHWLGLLLLSVVCLLALSSFVLSVTMYQRILRQSEISTQKNSKIISTVQEQRMAQCRADTLSELKPEKVDLKLLGGIHGLCYARVNEEDVLAEFGIRRGAFINQQSETGVLMWMVVIITFSGVILAAMQLLTGFKLALLGKANFEQGGQINLEANKLSISSSVTGVLVLAISLCFFYIFSKEIYLIRVGGQDSNSAPTKSIAGNLDMKFGWDPNLPQATSPLPQNFGKNLGPVDPAVAREALREQKASQPDSK